MDNLIDLREKYRPRTFSDIIGNASPIRILKRIITSGCFPQGIIIHGETGSGKTSLAYVFARASNCENFVDDLCGECEPCKSIMNDFPYSSISYGIHIHDCSLIDGKRLDEIFKNHLYFIQCNRIKKDFHIFDEFHRIRDASQDKFLRHLEINRNLLFIFCLIDISKIEKAFRDRTVVLKTSRPELTVIVPWLRRICNQEGIAIENPNALRQLATEANRSPRACLGTLQKILYLGEPITMALVENLLAEELSNRESGEDLILDD